MAERHKFAKRHQMRLAVKLRLVLRRNQQSGVVDLMRSLLDRAKQYIKSVRTGDLAHKIKCFLIFENGRWHCALGPDHEIDVRCGCESYFTQTRKFIKDCLLITDIEFFRARDRRLHQRYTQWMRGWPHLHRTDAQKKHRHQSNQREGETKMWPHCTPTRCFSNPVCCCSQDGIAADNDEGYARYS